MDTPMMRQYQSLKRTYPGALLMFRLGDFYELFGEDAEIASRVLGLTLTSRPVSKTRRIPMCGVPHHAVDGYIARLLERGYRVAICDQVEDPGKAKGLVRREVVRVITPGTIMEAALLPQRASIYIAAVVRQGGRWGIAFADLSTGELRCMEHPGEGRIAEEIARHDVREVLHPEGQNPPLPDPPPPTTPLDPWRFDPETARQVLCEQFNVTSLEGFGCAELPVGTCAAGALIQYLRETQRSSLKHFRRLQVHHPDEFVFLDSSTIRNLELVHSDSSSGSHPSCLLDVLDHTETAMGGRLLRRWLLSPLRSIDGIRARLEAVGELLRSPARPGLRSILRGMGDLERMVGRAGHGSANARDLVGLALTLEQVARLREATGSFSSPLLREIHGRLDDHQELREEIRRALVPDPPLTVREGGLIREGYDPELDSMREAVKEAKEWLINLEARERERTGIKTLKVGYNKVFGYYIEVTRPYLDRVPPDYEPRQTLVGAQRYVTPQMKEKEALILHAHERMCEREYELFCALRDRVTAASSSLLDTASAVGALDTLASLAEAAERFGYVEPELVEEPVLEIEEGRHPVVEQALRNQGFVPNTLVMGPSRRIAIVTGPNFAGKSTYLRQNAIIALMAQIGSFVPAKRARVGIVDRIFTRVGASDDIASGRSTFLVEMQETANILHNATSYSLVLLDEVGRGTATYDGLSIAWAVVEYLWKHIGCRTLFATHYHELTDLADRLPGVFNLNVLVREEGGRIVFLHRVADGASDRSYGIHVAQLAGLPEEAVERARQILETLQPQGKKPVEEALTPLARRRKVVQMGLPLIMPSPVEEEILRLDLASMTPMEAMMKLWELQERSRSRVASKENRDERQVDLHG